PLRFVHQQILRPAAHEYADRALALAHEQRDRDRHEIQQHGTNAQQAEFTEDGRLQQQRGRHHRGDREDPPDHPVEPSWLWSVLYTSTYSSAEKSTAGRRVTAVSRAFVLWITLETSPIKIPGGYRPC